MLTSWFGSKSSRHRQRRPPALDNAQSGPSEASSISPSLQTPGNLTSTSDVPLDEIHAHINDTSVYAPTPSLIHSADKDTGTLRTPNAPTNTGLGTPSLQLTAPQVSVPDLLDGTPFTPQDAILSQVFGKSVSPPIDPVHSTPPPPAQPSVSMATRTSDSSPPVPSTQTARSSSRVRPPGPKLTIYEPFSGAKLGEHTPTLSPSTTTSETPVTDPPCASFPTTDDRRLWSSLERILELQAEIAAIHADMEGVGKGNVHVASAGGIGTATVGEGGRAGSRRRSRRGQTLFVGDEEPEEHAAGLTASEISTDPSEGEGEDEDEDDVHGYGKRQRDEEFIRLAEQFAQRKTAIGGIMNKLEDLSMALKTFHTLPAPMFDLAMPPSRAETMSSAPSSPPLYMYPRRTSTLLSAVSLPSTTPTVPLSPPAPPMSPFVPVTSSEGPNTAREPGAVVVPPVLPRTALPAIILGATHVESPADMNPVESVFRRPS